MPKQEVFFEQRKGNSRVEVVKTYDQKFAREAFDDMEEVAQRHLWNALGISAMYEPEELPERPSEEAVDFLWEELLDAAREDGNLLSFFVVNAENLSVTQNLYVGPDCQSAEEFAKAYLGRG